MSRVSTSRRPTISACVIARNEADELAECLAGLTWADEIVVVDDESTDGPVKVAERFTPRVLVRAKRDDFAAQRNFALDAAVGEWVLFVDADERVTDALREEILTAVRAPGVEGYFVRRQDINFGYVFRYGESMRAPLLRLARRGAGRFEGRVHEIWRVGGATRILRSPLLHYSHADVSAFVRKVDYQSSLAATRLAEEGRGAHAWELVVHPLGNFFRNYVVHQGFRDGVPGLIYAALMALHPFLARAKRWERSRRP
jgi:glycosyltransferase involved in cell wall biosynthesis